MTALLFLIISNNNAQRSYISLSTGYGLGFNTLPSYNRDNTTYKKVNYSLGEGVNIGSSYGYMHNKYIGAELGMTYLIGGTTTTNSTVSYYYGQQVKNTVNIHSNMIRINPSLVIYTGKKGINPYIKIGAIIGMGPIIKDINQVDEYPNNTPRISVMQIKHYGGIALGTTASIGAIFRIDEAITLFGELTFINMTYAPTKSEITKYIYNNTDILGSLSTRQRKTEYVEQIEQPYYSSDSQPYKSLKQKQPFGSIGLNTGVRYNF